MGRGRMLDVLEAVYDLDAPPAVWQDAIVDEAVRAFPGAIGGLGFRYRLEGGAPALTGGVSGDPHYLGVPDEGHSSIDQAKVQRAYTAASHAEPTKLFHADEKTGKAPEALERMWSRLDVSDMFGIYATNARGESMTVGIAMPRVTYRDVQSYDWRPLCRDWTSIARHLEIALAARAGTLVAEIDEREARRAAESGLSLWGQMLHGRWSIVRKRTSNGRVRFLVFENPPGDRLRALSPLEQAVVERAARGEANKVIAADLGVHVSSAAEILTRAMRKMGVDQRPHLALLARVLRRET